MSSRVNPETGDGKTLARAHWPILVILAVAAALLFVNLDRDTLWADEGDTAVLARNILKFGMPSAWDGTTFTDSDFGARVNDQLIMVSSPWLQYYVVAGSFALLGDTAFAARAPFAVLALVTIALTYVLVWQATRYRWTAVTAAALLILSVQFLIYGRQSRHYALNAALTCLLVLLYSRLTSWRGAVLFAVAGTLLFHSHPIGVAPVLALGALTFIPAYRSQRPWFLRSALIMAPLTLPWLLLAGAGYEQNTGLLSDLSVFLPRLGQYAIECGSVTGLLGALVLFVVLRRRSARVPLPSAKKGRPQPARPGVLPPAERGLVLSLLAVLAAYGLMMAVTQPRDAIFSVGMRYTPAVIPFATMITAMLIARVSRFDWRPWVALVLLFGFTKLGRLTPWTFWEQPLAKRDPSAAVTFHNPERLVDRVLRTGQLAFLRSLVEQTPGTTSQIVNFLNANAGRQDIVVTNYAWEPLYFHTGLAQGMTVLPFYPIFGAAKDRGLPDYVFKPDGARWVVWRRAWGAYRGQALEEVLTRFHEAKIPVTLVASIPETLWENRENIHFRRFPGNRYLYPWFGSLPEALIYRIDWPLPNGGGKGGL